MAKKIFSLLSILFTNVVLIVLVFVCAETVSFHILQDMDPNFHYKFMDEKFDRKYQQGDFHRDFRPVERKNNKKGSIILFGCCMTYGVGIDDDNQTLSHYISKYTNRTTYNRSIPGWGLQHMYYQLTNPNFKKEIDVKPDYIIYTFIKDHYRRLYMNSSANEPYYLKYKIKNNKLVKVDESLINRSLLAYLARSVYCNHHYDADLVDYYFIQSYKQAKKLWPDVKFIIFNLDDEYPLKNDSILTENGIQIVDIPQFSDNESIEKLPDYWGDDSGHPAGKYWEWVIPSALKEVKW